MTAPVNSQEINLDPGAVIGELLEIPEARPLWALAQERTARKQLQGQLADAARRIAELENAKAQTTPPATDDHDPVADPSQLGLGDEVLRGGG